eukprot:4896744-Heterocapsa_arctica.AAC.1
MLHAVDGGCHGGDEALPDVGVLGQLHDLLHHVLRDLVNPDVTLLLDVHRLQLRAEDGEAGASVRRRIVQAT